MLRSPFKFLALFILAVLGIYYLAAFCDHQTDGFSLARIHSDLPFNSAWETQSSRIDREELLKRLNQKYHYLGFGGQCYAFVSEDSTSVIKFLKHKIRKPFSFFLQLPLPKPLENKRLKKLHKALFKLERDYTSYKIAFEEMPEETGVLYLHLNKTNTLKHSLTIVDKLGIEHTVNLDEVEFIMQKRAKLAYAYIEELMESGNITEARLALRSMLDVIVARCKKGIFDEDAKIHRNFGFVDAKPIFIDVGRFRRDPERVNPAVYRGDLNEITGRFREWLEDTHPSLAPILDTELHEYQKS